MAVSLSIFEICDGLLNNEIYIHGLENNLQRIISNMGGLTTASKTIGVRSSRLKEWKYGRSPIPLSILKKLVLLFPKEKKLVDSADIYLSCRYSAHILKFPKVVSEDLAYIIGLILGDGSLSGDSHNSKGNWGARVFFDNELHQSVYDDLVMREFGIMPKHYRDGENCHCSYFGSKVFHQFLRNYFGICNGFKCDKIEVPGRILASNNRIVISFLRGLFDSDGTITSQGYVKYSSTSKKIAGQVKGLLEGYGLKPRLSIWVKNNKYLPLYSVELRKKESVLRFAQLIGFRHPVKSGKLMGFRNIYSNSQPRSLAAKDSAL